jgi:hypothetical protein
MFLLIVEKDCHVTVKSVNIPFVLSLFQFFSSVNDFYTLKKGCRKSVADYAKKSQTGGGYETTYLPE